MEIVVTLERPWKSGHHQKSEFKVN